MKPTLRRSEVEGLLACAAYQSDGSEAAAFGTAVHAGIAAYWKAGARTLTADQLRGVAPDRHAEAQALVDRYIDTHGAAPDVVEVTETVETPHAFLTGTPDQLTYIGEDGVLVTDVKTSWAIGDATFQTRFYCALLAVNVPTLRTFYGRADHIRLSDGVVEYGPWDREELLAWWNDTIVAALPALLKARENPTPTGGAACQFCRHRMTCGASISPARDVPATTEEAARLTSELVRIEAAADAHKAALKAYFAERDPMVVGGVEVGWLRSKEASFKPTAAPLTISSWLEESGYSGPAVLSLDRSKIPKAVARLLVDSGLGTFEQGQPTFKTRKAS